MQPNIKIETNINPSATSESLPPQMALMQLVMGYWVSQSIYAAAQLGVADYLSDGEKSHIELAEALNVDAASLYRLLRALASVSIFAETETGKFTITPLAQFLRRDVPGSIRDVSIMMGDREHYNSWGNILHAVKTGQSGFEGLFGMNVFEYYSQNSEPAAIFDRAMTGFSNVENTAVCTEYDFSALQTIVDVAGGQGTLVTDILRTNSHMRGILFDLPEVIERAKPYISDSDISDRLKLVSGSFFDGVPTGCDAYILKHIIHDWDDERAIAILKQCHQAMNENGRVLVVEQVIPPGNDPFMGKFLDVNMLVMCPGGKERTAEEFCHLFASAGFLLTRIVPTPALASVVEGVKA